MSHRKFAITDADQPLIDQLSPEHQEILSLKGKYEDVAAQLGIKVGTVKSRKNRARNALEALRVPQQQAAE